MNLSFPTPIKLRGMRRRILMKTGLPINLNITLNRIETTHFVLFVSFVVERFSQYPQAQPSVRDSDPPCRTFRS